QVLKVPLESLGRRWEIRPGEAVASLPLSTSREVVASFRASPDYAYVVVPHAGRAGEEGAFILRTLSASPLEVEQLPAPLCLVVGGQWTGFLTGGGRSCPTWGSNPQYMVSCSQRAQVVASLTRLDLKYALIKAPRDPALDLDLVLARPEQGPDGPGRRAAVRDPDLVAAAQQQQLAGSNEEVVMSVVLEPETPYVLVPSIATPGIEGPYELRLMSGVPLELVPLPEMQCMQLGGEWSPETAGGCNVNPLWRRNPKFHIVLTSFGRVRITLSRSPGRKPRHPVDDMLGLYILRAAGADGEIRGDPRRAVVAESTFVPQPDTTAEYELNGGCHYVIMPCTYGPGRLGRFHLAVSSATPFQFKAL
ncbi:Calpain-type cysteine protease dek1, partial [Pleodorina starrii]